MGLRYILITQSFTTSHKVLEILILGSNHSTNLIMPLLNKAMERSMLRLNISPVRNVALLEWTVDISIVLGRGRLG